MADKRRFPKLSIGIRVILIVVLLYSLWCLPQSDHFLNVLLAFLFAGAIPGTNIVLSPESMLKAVIITAACFIIVVIAGSVYSAWRRNRRLDSVVVAAEPRPSEDMKPVSSVAAPARVKKQPKEDKIVVKIPIPKQRSKFNLWLRATIRATAPMLSLVMRRLYRRVGAYMPIVGAVAERSCRRATRNLLAAFNAMYAKTKLIARWFAAAVAISILFIRTKAVAFWKWVVPYLWRLDSWLEKRTRRALAFVNGKISNNENAHFALLLTRRSIDHIRSSKLLAPQNNVGQKQRKQDEPEVS